MARLSRRLPQAAAAPAQWRFPDEGEPHQRTWMAFIADDRIWHPRQVPEVQRNLATIAKTIARYEAVAMLVRDADYATALRLLGGREGAADGQRYPIELFRAQMNALWMRDTGPAFVFDAQGGKAALDFNFNGWGEDQDYALDASVASRVAELAGVLRLSSLLTLEGGAALRSMVRARRL